jgi:hypothetical protein
MSIRRPGVRRYKIVVLSWPRDIPFGSPGCRAESDKRALIEILVAVVPRSILAITQVERMEQVAIAEANGCSRVTFGELEEVGLLGGTAVLAERQRAALLIQQATSRRCKGYVSSQPAGHRASPIDDQPVQFPSAKQERLEVWH